MGYYCRERLYANMDELYAQVPKEVEDPYGYGDESIYDSICYYRPPVSSRQIGYTDLCVFFCRTREHLMPMRSVEIF